MSLFARISLLLLVIVFTSAPLCGTETKPFGIGKCGQMHALAYDAADGNTIYMGSDMCGVHVTFDHGATWEFWSKGMTNPDEVRSFYAEDIISIASGSWEGVFAATYGGIYHRPPAGDWTLLTPRDEFSFKGGDAGDTGTAIPFSCFALSPDGNTLYAGAGYTRWQSSWYNFYPALSSYTPAFNGPPDQFSIWSFDLTNPGAGWLWDAQTAGFGAVRQISTAEVNGTARIVFATREGAYYHDGSAWADLDTVTAFPLTHDDVWGIHITPRGHVYALLGRGDDFWWAQEPGGLLRCDIDDPTPAWDWIGSTAPMPPHTAPGEEKYWTTMVGVDYSYPIFLTVRNGVGSDPDDVFVGERASSTYGGLYRTSCDPALPGADCDWRHVIYPVGDWTNGFDYYYLDSSNTSFALDPGWLHYGQINPLCHLAFSPADPQRMVVHLNSHHYVTVDDGEAWDQVFCDPVGTGWTSRNTNLMAVTGADFMPDGTMLYTGGDVGLFTAVDTDRSGFEWNTREITKDGNTTYDTDEIWTLEATCVAVRPDYRGSGSDAVFAVFGEILATGSYSKIMRKWNGTWKNMTNTWDTEFSVIRDIAFYSDDEILAIYWNRLDRSSPKLTDIGVRLGTWNGSSYDWVEVNTGLAHPNPLYGGHPALRRHGSHLLALPGTSKILLSAMQWHCVSDNTWNFSGDVTSRGGVFCLDRGSTTWEAWLDGDPDPNLFYRDVKSMAVTPSGDVLYVGTRGHSTGYGTVLKAEGGPFTSPPASWEILANDDSGDGSFGFETNFYRSPPHGYWTPGRDLDRKMTAITSLAVSPLDPDRLYAGMEATRFHPQNGLWRYDPATGEWEHLAGNFNETCSSGIRVLAFDPADPAKILCGTAGEEWFEVVAEPFTLEVSALVPGSTAYFEATFARPGSTVFHLYSLDGGGPWTTPLGFVLDLTPPVRRLATQQADSHGTARFDFTVPAGAPSGTPLWCQAVERDNGDYRVSSGVETAVQ